MILLRQPTSGTPDDKAALFDVLTRYYDAIVELRRPRLPESVPALAAITLPTHAAMRALAGDATGKGAPLMLMVAGDLAPMDGGEGAYVWDPTSQAADNNTTVIAPVTLAAGRWRKATL